MSHTTAVVVGAGSIGLRHIRNLRALGVSALVAVDPVPERLKAAENAGARGYDRVEAALAEHPDLVLVCTPADSHLGVARAALQAGAHVFIEKPLAATLDGVDHVLALAATGQRQLAVGYHLRFHPGLQKLKRLLDDNLLGRVLSIRTEFGQYLPEWRPDQDYRTGYHARADIGGILLDASHEIDYVRWLFGEVSRVSCVAGHLSSLETAAEDFASVALRMASGAVAEVHLDCIQRGYARNCKVIGEHGTATWDFSVGVGLLNGAAGGWRQFPISVDSNTMYVDEMRHFLQCVRGEAEPLVDGATGRRVLEIVLASKQSAARHCEIAV